MHPVHILADPAVHQAVAYVPMTAKDKVTAIQGGFVAGTVIAIGLFVSLIRAGSKKKPATSE